MKTITLCEREYIDLLNTAQLDDFSRLIHKLWEMELDYINLCHNIQTGGFIERPENEDPVDVLETLRETYNLSMQEITSRLWTIRTISEILQASDAVIKYINHETEKAATPQPAPVPSTSEAVAAHPDMVCVNSEALDNIQQLTAMVKDLHAEQVHTEKMLARCRDLMRARGISEDEINQQSE